MKFTRIVLPVFTALLLFSACSTNLSSEATHTTSAPQPNMPDAPGIVPAGMGTTPQWNVDEFRQDDEDGMFFAPATGDYMLTEVYGQTQADTGIQYTLTILRSFDEAGNVVAQIEKLTFDIPPDAEFCYQTLSQDGTDYPSLVCTGYSVYIEQTAATVAEQRTKEQFTSDYQADGIKYWLSSP